MDNEAFQEFRQYLKDMYEILTEVEERLDDHIEKVSAKLERIKYLPEANDFPIKDYPEVKAPTPELRDQLILDTYPYCLLADKPDDKNV